jgi:hypothetical protein
LHGHVHKGYQSILNLASSPDSNYLHQHEQSYAQQNPDLSHPNQHSASSVSKHNPHFDNRILICDPGSNGYKFNKEKKRSSSLQQIWKP